MSAPHVAGVVARLLSHNHYLSADEIRRILVDSASHPAGPGVWDRKWGYGEVNVVKAMKLLAERPTADGLKAWQNSDEPAYPHNERRQRPLQQPDAQPPARRHLELPGRLPLGPVRAEAVARAAQFSGAGLRSGRGIVTRSTRRCARWSRAPRSIW